MERGPRIEQPRARRERRSQVARVATLVGVVGLAFALVEVQVRASDHYALIAKENRLRPVVVPAPRGTIYDRHGQVLAENVVGFQVLLMPAPEDSLRATLARLRPVLGLTDERIADALQEWRKASNLPMVVLPDAHPAAVARLEERRFAFPEVLLREYPKRSYPAGEAAAHVLGYVAEISEAELELPEFRDYRQGRLIGKAGLERSYEASMGGVPGVRYLEVDALGRIKGWLPEELGIPSIPGEDLRLHLDLELQRYVMELFQSMSTAEGAFVALDPKTGGVLALYSTPGFDPNLFIGGIEPETWTALNDDPAKPLLGRAAAVAQPPGSSFKPLVAAMALGLDVIEPEEYMPIACGGGMSYGGRYARCWGVHGRQNMILGIKNSCDVYFYQVGIRIGLERFLETGTRMGFAKPTGIDLPNETKSIFPPNLKWWEQTFGYHPAENEIMSLSIGQGAVTMTPLKLAHMFVALARLDGKAPAPRLVDNGKEAPIAFELPTNPRQIWQIRRGMRRVVGPGGTAALTRLQGWDFIGKTGTAQNPHGPDHAWFGGIGGPFGGEPEIVAVAYLAHGLHGYTASEPVANAINFYLNRIHGRPFVRHPVPRQRMKRQMDIDWAWLYSEVEDPPPPTP